MGSCGEEVIPLIWTILALLCIVLGFVGEFIDEKILIGTLEWFVAAIAFNTIGGLPGVFTKRRG
jgi:predicted permease